MNNPSIAEILKHLGSRINFNDLVLNSFIKQQVEDALNRLKEKGEFSATEVRLIKLQLKTAAALARLTELLASGFESELEELNKIRDLSKRKKYFLGLAEEIRAMYALCAGFFFVHGLYSLHTLL